MSGVGKTEAVSVHKFRRRARAEERRIQGLMEALPGAAIIGVPDWARGVRVEKAGAFSWVVIATEKRGH